jgi:hypothetical protein
MSEVIKPAPFKLVKSEVLPLTLKLAEEFRDLAPSPTERELNQSRLKYLREKVEAGLFVSLHWATSTLKGQKRRMNGQHSSTMLSGLNGTFPQGLYAHIDHYEVEDDDGEALLFRQFDAPKSGRSRADVAGAYQGLHEDLRGLPRPNAKLGVDGIVWWRRNVEGVPVASGDSAYEIFGVKAQHPFLLWIGEIFTVKTPELRRPSIVAAMYATFTASETNARKFWFEVARGGVEFEEDHPTTVLDEWLKKLKEDRDDMKPGNFYQGCIYAWNAYRAEKTIPNIKYDYKKGFLKAAE